MNKSNNLMKLILYIFIAFLVGCTQSAPSKSLIEKLVLEELNDQNMFDISNLEIIKDYWDGEHSYIVDVSYTRTAIKSFKDTINEVVEEYTKMNKLEQMQLNLTFEMLKMQYGEYSLGDSFQVAESIQLSLSRDGWVYTQRLQ